VNGQRPVVGTGEVITVPAITLDDFLAVGGRAASLLGQSNMTELRGSETLKRPVDPVALNYSAQHR
jgi:hypothetical protein